MMMREQRNIDWTAAFALAARAGPHELVRALRTAMETEFAAFTEKYDAILARQRAECDEILAQQRAEYHANLARQRAEYQQQLAELLAKVENEYAALRRELAAAYAELDRLRQSPAPQQAH